MQRVDSLMEEAAMIFFLKKMARRDKFKGVSWGVPDGKTWCANQSYMKSYRDHWRRKRLTGKGVALCGDRTICGLAFGFLSNSTILCMHELTLSCISWSDHGWMLEASLALCWGGRSCSAAHKAMSRLINDTTNTISTRCFWNLLCAYWQWLNWFWLELLHLPSHCQCRQCRLSPRLTCCRSQREAAVVGKTQCSPSPCFWWGQ